MSRSEPEADALPARMSELAASLIEAVEENRAEAVPDEVLGQLFASVVRLYAAKAQAGGIPPAFGRNSGITATDVMIACTGMLDAARLQTFELSMWQAWTRTDARGHAGRDVDG